MCVQIDAESRVEAHIIARHYTYRIIYSIEEARLVVLVVKIGHRREVYRGER